MDVDRKQIEKFLKQLWMEEQNINVENELLGDIKKVIYSKFDKKSSFIKNRVISIIEKEFDNVTLKYINNYPLENKNLQKLEEYIEYILNNKKHYFNQYMNEAIKYNYATTVWGDNLNYIFLINRILTSSMEKFLMSPTGKVEIPRLQTKYDKIVG